MLDRPLRALAAAVTSGEVTAAEVTRGFLARAAARPEIGAWAHLDPAHALAEAEALDTSLPRPLLGIPIGVKDVMDTADQPTAYGSAAFAGHRPAADAGAVALARAAGATVLGKTVTTEFAAAAPRQTRNPFKPDHTPGGSSSGSAAAVGAGLVPLAFGTQTAGSIIRPASYCGVVGYKPSFGLIARSGVSPLADTLDTIGLMARRVADVAWATAAIAGRPALAEPRLAGTPHIGLYDRAGWNALSPENQAALALAERALEGAGAKVMAMPRFACHDALLDAQQAIMDWEVPRALAHARMRFFDRLSPLTQAFLTRPEPSPETYDAALETAAAARAAIAQRTAGLDAWIAPAAPGLAPQGLESTGDPLFNRVWTVLHLPCLTVPTLRSQGLPLGVQIIARDDATALALAAFLETALNEVV